MNKTKQLQDLGQSPWLDNIPRETLDDGRPAPVAMVGRL